jgi:hypothetical protein
MGITGIAPQPVYLPGAAPIKIDGSQSALADFADPLGHGDDRQNGRVA